MSPEARERALATLVAEWWARVDLGRELSHLPGVDRVQAELRDETGPAVRHLVWERGPGGSRAAAAGRTVRLVLLGAEGLEALLDGQVEPKALCWGRKLAAVGPPPAADWALGVLPACDDGQAGAMPPAGLLSLPPDTEPSVDALTRGLQRWARAIDQAHGLLWPRPPYRTTVTVECVVAGLGRPLRAYIAQPRRAPVAAGPTVRLCWESGRDLWANFAAQLSLGDATLAGLCMAAGDIEAMSWLLSGGAHEPY